MWMMRDLCLHLLPVVVCQQVCQPSTLVRNPCPQDVVVVTQHRDLSFCCGLARWFPLDIQVLHVSSAGVQLEAVVLLEVEKSYLMFQLHPQEVMAKRDHGGVVGRIC